MVGEPVVICGEAQIRAVARVMANGELGNELRRFGCAPRFWSNADRTLRSRVPTLFVKDDLHRDCFIDLPVRIPSGIGAGILSVAGESTGSGRYMCWNVRMDTRKGTCHSIIEAPL